MTFMFIQTGFSDDSKDTKIFIVVTKALHRPKEGFRRETSYLADLERVREYFIKFKFILMS